MHDRAPSLSQGIEDDEIADIALDPLSRRQHGAAVAVAEVVEHHRLVTAAKQGRDHVAANIAAPPVTRMRRGNGSVPLDRAGARTYQIRGTEWGVAKR